jgi:acyl-coenzyme A thioesterase PaaI-like protein
MTQLAIHSLDPLDTAAPVFSLDAVPFRLPKDKLDERVADFNQRREVVWFGLQGSLYANTHAHVRFADLQTGFLGGGGRDAINGGVIAAGFDAVCVLAGLTQFDVKVMMTLTLQVQFLRLASSSTHLEFQACVTKSARNICFVQGVLIDTVHAPTTPLAMASATLAPLA